MPGFERVPTTRLSLCPMYCSARVGAGMDGVLNGTVFSVSICPFLCELGDISMVGCSYIALDGTSPAAAVGNASCGAAAGFASRTFSPESESDRCIRQLGQKLSPTLMAVLQFGQASFVCCSLVWLPRVIWLLAVTRIWFFFSCLD